MCEGMINIAYSNIFIDSSSGSVGCRSLCQCFYFTVVSLDCNKNKSIYLVKQRLGREDNHPYFMMLFVCSFVLLSASLSGFTFSTG